MTGDNHPIHYDATYAQQKGWDAPLAQQLSDSMVAMLGNDVSYKTPAIMGDTITP